MSAPMGQVETGTMAFTFAGYAIGICDTPSLHHSILLEISGRINPVSSFQEFNVGIHEYL